MGTSLTFANAADKVSHKVSTYTTAPRKVRITFFNPSISVVSSPALFTLVSHPSISSLSPQVAYASSTITVEGSNFISFSDDFRCSIRIFNQTHESVSSSCTILTSSVATFVVPSSSFDFNFATIQILMKNPSTATGISDPNGINSRLSIINLPFVF